jgi:hypothetical protein
VIAVALVLAPGAEAAWGTLQQAASAAAQARLATDETQPDRPTFSIELVDPLVRPRGRPRKDVDDLYWQRFAVSGEAHELDSGTTIPVTFTLGADGAVTDFRGPPADPPQPDFPIRGAFIRARVLRLRRPRRRCA